MSRSRIKLVLAVVLVGAAAAAALAEPRHATSDSGSERHSDAYREGQHALASEAWDDASRIFGKLASRSSDETDAALYWKAYADWKQKMKKESLEGLRQLLASYPKSTWADDAQALEIEIRGGKGAGGTQAAENEELKLYALDGLMQVEPAQAVPALEKLLAGSSSQRVKARALFVLSQSDSPKAREILLRTAKSGQPVSLRCEAVKTLAIAGEPEDIATIATIARDTAAPPEVRDAVIEAYIIADRPDELLGIAKSDPDARLRAKAIDALGAIGALPSLRQLWGTEKDPALSAKLLEAFGVAGDVDTLAKAARETPDPRLRRKAIEGLGISSGPAAAKLLRQMYREFSDPDDKRKVLEALMIQGDAKTLIELFRAEKDPAMKKAILQQLSVMNDPDATRAILDVLGD
jgi:HEAT repeat protein